jgi:hypothetical protein
MEVTGYKYTTEQEAIDARKQCADYYGIPVAPDDVTQYWVDYQQAEDFWYIIFDESIADILGEPEEFEIQDKNIESES